MRKIIRAIALAIGLLPGIAAAQSAPPNLPYHTLYGFLGAAPGTSGPGEAIPFASLQALLGPVFGPNTSTIGHIATFGNGLGTVLADGGAISALWTNGLGVMPCGNFPVLTGNVTNTSGSCSITVNYTSPLTGGTQRTLTGKLSEYVSVFDFGAFGDCVNDDTAAFQAAQNSGAARIHVPPAPGGCYLVTKVNGTNHNNIIWEGDGDQSLIKINGGDADDNWWDLSGSNNVQFKNLRFIDNGAAHRILFLWACTGTSCGTSLVLSGLSFDHVNLNVKTTLAALYAYGYGCAANCASNISGGSLSISNSSWQNTNNGPSSIAETRNALLDLTAYNVGSIRSVYVTIATATAIAARTHIYNSDFIDRSTTGTTLSNNAAAVTDGVNQMAVTGGSFQCQCVADFIGWTSDEGVSFTQTAFQDPVPGSSCATLNWLQFGGGLNSILNFTNVFFSCPGAGGAYIAADQGPSAGSGGLAWLTVTNNDVGLNTNGVPFIGKTAAGCGSFSVANVWLLQVSVQVLAGTGTDAITTCGSIDAHSVFWGPSVVTVPSGATDSSHHF
jgi:hypothetical protein